MAMKDEIRRDFEFFVENILGKKASRFTDQTFKEHIGLDPTLIIIDDVSMEEVLDPDMEVSIVYQCERCHSNPPELFKIFGKGIQDSIMLCKYCEKAFNTFILRDRGIMGFMRSGYRVEKINNRS